MLSVAAMVGFAIVLLPVVLSPGVSFTLVTTKGLRGDRVGVVASIMGTAAGILSHAAAAGLGLALVVMRSAEVYSVIRLAGAAYLVGLGAHMLWRTWKSRGVYLVERNSGPDFDRRQSRWGRSLFSAYAANVLNVKAAAVYLTLAPQFLSAEQVSVPSMLGLGAVHVVLMAAWLGAWAGGVGLARSRFDVDRWTRWLQAAAGFVLIGLGVRTVASR